jgi:murein DD-endopeptidase MepM/ murein hydrolase activator NlpD
LPHFHLVFTLILVIILLFLPGYSIRSESHPQLDLPPFKLPFLEPSGADTWLLVQPYGHTVRAYQQRDKMYRAGQGLHFGVDFYARCGYPVYAIGAGVVAKIDAREFGSRPHNLMIDHPNGLASFYGHLLETPDLQVGQRVEQGQMIAKVGDPEQVCLSRSHLHLEIRNAGRYTRAYNPVPLIQADWDTLALNGPEGIHFAYDLNSPNRWHDMFSQPEVVFHGPRLNDYTIPWPLDWLPYVFSLP